MIEGRRHKRDKLRGEEIKGKEETPFWRDRGREKERERGRDKKSKKEIKRAIERDRERKEDSPAARLRDQCLAGFL